MSTALDEIAHAEFPEAIKPALSRLTKAPIRVNASRCVWALGTIVFCLIVLNLGTRIPLSLATGEISAGVVEVAYRFDLDRENTLGAWYSSLTLFFSAVLLGIIARDKFAQRDKFAFHWAMLALIFVSMSLDESAAIHEISMVPLRRFWGLSGFFYFAWIVPGAVALVVLALAYIRFLWHLDQTTQKLFMLAAATFVGGALLLESLGGMLAESEGFHSLAYILVSTLEESCEMLGILIFIYALVKYLGQTLGTLSLDFRFDAGAAK